MEEKRIEIYDWSKTFKQNFEEINERHLVFRISREDNIIELIPDSSTVIITKPAGVKDHKYLSSLITDYYSLFGLRYNMFKRYNPRFFTCDERIFFEGLLIKFRKSDFKKFEWAKDKILYELGIKRSRLNTIISNFEKLGIIDHAVVHSIKTKTKKNKASFFVVNPERIMELTNEIYFKFEISQAQLAMSQFLKPALK